MSTSYQSTKEYSSFLRELSRGGVCVFPTDTVVGIGCLAFYGKERVSNLAAVNKIFEIKNRCRDQKLPWLVSGIADIERYASGDLSLAREVVDNLWPGDVTIVLPVSIQIDDEFCVKHNDQKTLAMRCPNTKYLLSAIEELGSPIVCTSANISGEPAVASVEEVSAKVLAHADFVYTGEEYSLASTGCASKIYDCCGDEVVRLR